MKQTMGAVWKALMRGLLIVVPVYLAILLLLKGMKSVANLVRPFTALLPDWVPAEELLSLLLVLAICAVIGATVGTRIGRGARDWLERSSSSEFPATGSSAASRTRWRGEAARGPGGPRWSRSKMPLFRGSSSRSSRTGATPYSSRRSRRRSRVPSTFSIGSGCIRWTCRSPMRSGSSRAGDRVRRTWSRRWSARVRRATHHDSRPACAGAACLRRSAAFGLTRWVRRCQM